MKKAKQPAKEPEVVWHEEKQTLMLEEEPVLEYVLSWPEIQGAGIGGCWISRYYARLAELWRLRWQREIYWKACIKLSQCRAASRPFTPWTGRLEGTVTLWQDGLLSLRMEGEEIRGDGRPCRVRWGDVWKLREGAPCPLKDFFPGKRRWKKALVTQITERGNQLRAAGDCFLDQGWEKKVAKFLPTQDFCLTSDGLEFAFPQCVIAPAAEGNPVFCIPLKCEKELQNTPA